MLKKIIITLIGCVLIITGALYWLNSPPDLMMEEKIFINKGGTVGSAARGLKEKNLIKHENFFKFLAVVQGAGVINGRYKIFKGMTSNEILGRLSRGDILKRKVTIPEGYNVYEIAERLSKEEIIDYDDFIKFSFDKDFLSSAGISSSSAEGYLYPDTYIFAEGKDARDIIIIMHNRLKEVIKSTDLSAMRKLNLNEDKLLNLASLIEKEAKVASERELISAVFHNRLRQGIALYCDPTVRYAVKKFDGRLTYSDLQIDSPYNTYKHRDLPPTPICSPGKDSIIAGLNPANSSYLYFVARNDGSHYFSKTLKEHNRAVDFYQKGIKNGFIDNQKK